MREFAYRHRYISTAFVIATFPLIIGYLWQPFKQGCKEWAEVVEEVWNAKKYMAKEVEQELVNEKD